MKYDKIQMMGEFITQKVTSNPVYISAQHDSCIIYNTSEKKTYFGDGTGWKEVLKTDDLYNQKEFPISNGSLLWDSGSYNLTSSGFWTVSNATYVTNTLRNLIPVYTLTTTSGYTDAYIYKSISAWPVSSAIPISFSFDAYVPYATWAAGCSIEVIYRGGDDYGGTISFSKLGTTTYGGTSYPIIPYDRLFTITVETVASGGRRYHYIYLDGKLYSTTDYQISTSTVSANTIKISHIRGVTSSTFSLDITNVRVGCAVTPSLTPVVDKTAASIGTNSGYVLGGVTDAANNSASKTVQKLAFETDSNSILISSLDTTFLPRSGGVNPQTPKFESASVSSNSAGYGIGGLESTNTVIPGYTGVHMAYSYIDKFSFSNETSYMIGNWTSAFQGSAGLSSKLAGYVCGGGTKADISGALSIKDTIGRFTFTTETSQTLSTSIALSTAKYSGASFNSQYVGYICGGKSSESNASKLSTIDKFIFSNESPSAMTQYLNTQIYQACGFKSSFAGYTHGGLTGSTWLASIATINKLNFNTELTSSISSTISLWTTAVGGSTAMASQTYGYVCGGYKSTASLASEIKKLYFASDIFSTKAISLSSANRTAYSFSNI